MNWVTWYFRLTEQTCLSVINMVLCHNATKMIKAAKNGVLGILG
jgi:hypothetical protein